MAYQAVIFDAFGTILQIQDGSHPYRQLLREGMRHGRRPKPDDARSIMTLDGGMSACAEHLAIQISPQRLAEIEAVLELEVASIQAYSDAVEAVELLQQHQLKVGVCSNLAHPYGAAVMRLFPTLDAYTFSFEIGDIKPEPVIYQAACRALQYDLGEISDTRSIIMIGDSLRCDCEGPRAMGMTGIHLERSSGGKVDNLMSFAKLVLGTG